MVWNQVRQDGQGIMATRAGDHLARDSVNSTSQ